MHGNKKIAFRLLVAALAIFAEATLAACSTRDVGQINAGSAITRDARSSCPVVQTALLVRPVGDEDVLSPPA
jgi:hypothetical protein